MNKFGKHIFVVLFMLSIAGAALGQRIIQVRPGYNHPFRPQPYMQPNNMRNFNNNRGYRMQNPNMKHIQAIKEGFISRQLNLKPEQAEKFWPLYRRYQGELWDVKQLKRLNNSDAQANGPEQIRKDLDYEAQLVDIKKRYNEEFLKIMPPDKVSELYKSERGFTDELIKNLNERKVNAPQ